jgi:hypothetical protein
LLILGGLGSILNEKAYNLKEVSTKRLAVLGGLFLDGDIGKREKDFLSENVKKPELQVNKESIQFFSEKMCTKYQKKCKTWHT